MTIPTDKGAHAGVKINTLIAGMVAGADSINDMDLFRHGGMNRLSNQIYAPPPWQTTHCEQILHHYG